MELGMVLFLFSKSIGYRHMSPAAQKLECELEVGSSCE